MTNKILFIANWKMFGTKKTVKTINNVIKFSKRKHTKKAKIIKGVNDLYFMMTIQAKAQNIS